MSPATSLDTRSDHSRLRAAASFEPSPELTTKPQRARAFKLRGVFGGALTVAGAITVVSTMDPVPRNGSWLDVTIDGAAWLLFLVGTLLRFWSTLYIGSRKGHVVVDEGPYSLCRHPLYLGTFLLAGAAGLFLHSLTFSALVAIVVAYYVIYAVPSEEAELRLRLGQAYDNYCRRVSRFRLRWSGFRTSEAIPASASALAREFRRASRWIWLPIVGDVLGHLQLQPWWPNVFDLP
ncbi:MAG TPA: isoprenylcysteine carboxylmethyltransferase family protein [Pirellulales bacterium]|jgi:protein-S-isoprenylcysteine O-methyltransferase Ste14|nr:isoprenylcysteine carboxylmethyltransferase family protein [Pirellulales bacterium]